MSPSNTPAKPSIKVALFDFMGTCLDWHSIIVSTPPNCTPEETRSDFALEWRQAYFDASAARLKAGLEYEDIDTTHQKTLEAMLQVDKYSTFTNLFTDEVKDSLIQAWHHQQAWSDVVEALRVLKEDLGREVVVHANGTTRLQMDLIRSSGLKFDMLFSSEMLSVYKPAPESYDKALWLLEPTPEECVMVAAHAYDLQGAKRAGMKSVYVYRWTDDIREDQEEVKGENDVYLADGMGGLGETVRKLIG